MSEEKKTEAPAQEKPEYLVLRTALLDRATRLMQENTGRETGITITELLNQAVLGIYEMPKKAAPAPVRSPSKTIPLPRKKK